MSNVEREPEGSPPARGNDELRPPVPRIVQDNLVEPRAEASSESTVGDGTGYQTVNELHLDSLVLDDGVDERVTYQRPRRTESILQDTPRRRTVSAMVTEARAQFAAVERLNKTKNDDVEEDKRQEILLESGAPVFDGRAVQIVSVPREGSDVIVRMWDKERREDLPAEARLQHDRAATSAILSKVSRFGVPVFAKDGDGALETVEKLHTQLKMLGFHMMQFDMYDVIHIVIPVDVHRTMNLEKGCYNLMVDYPKLHPDIVANSNAWWNTWVRNSYVRENMVLLFLLLQNNTEPDLWAKCMELYEDYAPVQQGGPLMLCLILRRIQDQSEQALVTLVTRVSRIRISKTTGEDIESVIRLIKSTYRVLRNASTSARSYVPIDFSKTVLKVFQTSSVDEFNDAFLTVMRDCQTQADLKGISPTWPDLSTILTLANNTHQRMKHSGLWDGATRRSQAHNAIASAPPQQCHPARGTHTARGPRPVKCWNCGGQHPLPDCPSPRDEARIERAREQHRANNPRSLRGKPKYETGSDGKPLILNRQGPCVLDQKKWRRMRALLATPTTANTPTNDGRGTQSTAPARSPSGHVARHATAMRSALTSATSL